MIVNTTYVECYVKRSFLTDKPVYGKDDTIFGVIIGIRFIRSRAPLFIVYLPSLGAIYDKVDQCAIFNTEEIIEEEVTMPDVAWWDCISDRWQLIELEFLKNRDIEMFTRTDKKMSGTYLFTCDPQKPIGSNDYGQSEVWHEHKTKTFFFDDRTGALCCAPNNKMRVYDSSLCGDEYDSPGWLKVYKDSYAPERMSHENDLSFGNTDLFVYS